MALATLDLGVSGMDVSIYSAQCGMQWRTGAVFERAISENRRRLGVGGDSVIFSDFSGIDADTTAYTDGDDLTQTTPTLSQSTVSGSPYVKYIPISNIAAAAGPISNLIPAFQNDMVRLAAEYSNKLAATAIVAGNDDTMVSHVGQTVRANITASDTLTAAYVSRATANLATQKAPKIMLEDGRMVYCGYVHPMVAHDLFVESNGLTASKIQVNDMTYQLGALGVAHGVLWFEVSESALLNANAGSGNVDVYYTVICGGDSIGAVYVPIQPNPGVLMIPFDKRKAFCGLVSRPTSNLGLKTEVGCVCHVGYGICNQKGVFRLESASSIGDNT